MNASMTINQFRAACEAASQSTDYSLENRGPHPDSDSPTLWAGNVWSTMEVAGCNWSLNVSYYAQGGAVIIRDEWLSREGELPQVFGDLGQDLYPDEIETIVAEFLLAPAPVLPQDAE